MKALYDLTILVVVIVVAITATVGIVSSKYLGNDNPLEQAAEAIIKQGTGLDVDLSPEEKELQESLESN